MNFSLATSYSVVDCLDKECRKKQVMVTITFLLLILLVGTQLLLVSASCNCQPTDGFHSFVSSSQEDYLGEEDIIGSRSVISSQANGLPFFSYQKQH